MCIFAAMNENILPIHFAPLQGYTDAVYRRAHALSLLPILRCPP